MEEELMKIIDSMADRLQEQSELIARLTNICSALARQVCELRTDVDKLIENNKGASKL